MSVCALACFLACACACVCACMHVCIGGNVSVCISGGGYVANEGVV